MTPSGFPTNHTAGELRVEVAMSAKNSPVTYYAIYTFEMANKADPVPTRGDFGYQARESPSRKNVAKFSDL